MTQPIHPYAVYTTQEAAQALKLDPVTIQRYIRSRKLKATLIGKVYRISGQSLLDLMSLDSDSIKNSHDRIKQLQNARYQQSKSFLLNHEKGIEYFQLIDLTTEAMLSAWNPDFDTKTEEQLTLKYIGARLFNSAVAALELCLDGYYQASFATQRDLIEIQFLLELFKHYPERIKEWKEADDKTLRDKFSPRVLREILDKADGFKERKREARYKMYCKYAAHVTYAGFSVMANEDNQVEIGSFYDEQKLLNCIRDIVFNYSFAVMSFLNILNPTSLRAQKNAVDHMQYFHEVFKDQLPLAPEVLNKLSELNQELEKIFKHYKIPLTESS